MKKSGAFFVCLLLTLLCYAPIARAQDTLRLKAITYNLRFGELASLEELAARIASEKPDMVALQEVDCHTRREGIPHQHGKDFATELGFRTGMFPLYGKTIAFAGGWYGIGLLTARPYLGVRKLMLPQASAQEESRALLLVTVEVGQDTVVFASTHLGLSEESRRMQTECILNELKRSRYPVLLGGDFNAEPDAAEIAAMTSGCDLLCGMQPTFPADAPDVKIDYLFGYPAVGGRSNRRGSCLPACPITGRSFRSSRWHAERKSGKFGSDRFLVRGLQRNTG